MAAHETPFTVIIKGRGQQARRLRTSAQAQGFRVVNGGRADASVSVSLEDAPKARPGGTPRYVYDAFAMHPALLELAESLRSGAIGTLGFTRIRLTHPMPRGRSRPRHEKSWLYDGLSSPVYWLTLHAPACACVFAQLRTGRGSSAVQVCATFTLDDESIAQIDVSFQPRAVDRYEIEVVGDGGLLSVDTADEVLTQYAFHDGTAKGLRVPGALDAFWQRVPGAADDPQHYLNRSDEATRVLRRTLLAAQRACASRKSAKIARKRL